MAQALLKGRGGNELPPTWIDLAERRVEITPPKRFRPRSQSGGSASERRPAKPVSGQCHQATSGSSTSQQSQ